MSGPADVTAFADRLGALQQRIGLGVSDAATTDALQVLISEIDAAARAEPDAAAGLRWWAAAAEDARALTLLHRSRPAESAAAYRRAAATWTALGESERGRESAAAAVTQAVAAGGALDGVITDLVADLDGAQGLPRAALLVRLARLTADVGDHFEARRRADEAAALLAQLGYPDPTDDPAAAFARWLPPAPDLTDVATLRTVSTVLTTWGTLLGVRGAIGDGWAETALAALPGLSRRLLVEVGGPRDDTTQRVVGLSTRLNALQDTYDRGADIPDPEDWTRLLAATRAVITDAGELAQPAVVAMGRILEADLLTWAGQHEAAAAVLVAARTALHDATAVPEAMRTALVVQLIRRQVELAAAAQDSPAVSAFAGEGIAAVEADRQRLSLPYLQDSYLRDRRLIYVAGMAAARRLDDLDLLLERADLVKARGAVAWLRAGPAPVKAIRASLAADEAVIYHLWADRTVLYVITVHRDEIVCERRLLSDAQRADLDSLVSDFAALRRDASWPGDEIPPLGELLLPVDGARLLAGKRRLFVSPNGPLHQLPVHALSWQGRPLVESFAVSYVPNFAALTRRAGPSGTGGALVIGVGSFSDAPPLRTAEQEAAAVAGLYPGSDLLLGAAATRDALAARARDGRLARAALIHLATHGQDGPLDDPLAARFVLADGDVAGPALAGWSLSADLVVLSACWSAQRAVLGRDGSELFGDEVYGLQSAFFAAGARQVLGAMWPARDSVTATLMTRMHGLIAGGVPADFALQTAMIEARRADGLLYHWAPFKLTMLGRPPQPVESP